MDNKELVCPQPSTVLGRLKKGYGNNPHTNPNNTTSTRFVNRLVNNSPIKVTTNWQTCQPTPLWSRLWALLLSPKEGRE